VNEYGEVQCADGVWRGEYPLSRSKEGRIEGNHRVPFEERADCGATSAHSANELYEHYGLTASAIEQKAAALLGIGKP
jgi:hypothetical protein